MILNSSDFAYYSLEKASWCVDSGEYFIQVGSSSRDIRATKSIILEGEEKAFNPKLKSYNDVTNWPPTKEQFEILLGHAVPAERAIRPFTANSTLSEVQACFVGRMFYKLIKKNMSKQFGAGSSEGMEEFTKIIDAMLEDMPIRQLAMLSGGAMTPSLMDGLVELMNGHYLKGFKKLKG